MPTSWESVEMQALTYIKNDLSLMHDMEVRLPVFYNRMSAYMVIGMAKFNKPPEVRLKLANNTAPKFESVVYYAEEAISAATPIETGESGYDIASAGIVSEDAVGTPTYTPLPIVGYDTETGNITLSVDVAADTEIVFDFYKSGEFKSTLNIAEADLLAMCIYNAWEHRFDNNALERIPKIRDSSSNTISEASQTNANTARLRQVDEKLNDDLRAYEQSDEYMRSVLKIRTY